jgi:hypothetical protein
MLFGIDVEDLENFASGVDKTSVTAAVGDLGHQSKIWIMAPAGQVPAGIVGAGQDCSNKMSFEMPFAREMVMTMNCAHASPTEGNVLNLSGDQTRSWHGTVNTTTPLPEPNVAWSLGRPGKQAKPAALPIGIKTMKNRKVKVVVHFVTGQTTLASGNIQLQPPTSQPTAEQIKGKLFKVFTRQINTWFNLECVSHEIPWDIGTDADWGTVQQPVTGSEIGKFNYRLDLGGSAVLGADPTSVEEQKLLAFRSNDSDVDVFVIGGCVDIQSYSGLNGVAINFDSKPKPGMTKRVRRAVYIAGGAQILSKPTLKDSLLHEIAHEIGHVIIGNGHPDDLTDNGTHAGEAPLKGTNVLERLMFSDETVKKNAGKLDRNLLVKKEWDEAEKWLSARPNGDN